MSMQGENILKSLELASKIQGDLTDPIYKALFQAHPEMEELFILDTDNSVRGSMLQHTFECIMDYVGDRTIAPTFIASTRYVHDGYGVPEGEFDEFFVIVRDTCKSVLKEKWTPEMSTEWDAMLKDFSTMAL